MTWPGRRVAAASSVIELLEDLALDRQVLGHRLDHHVGVARLIEADAAADALQDLAAALRRPGQLLRHPLEIPADRGEGAVEQLLPRVDHRDLETAAREHLGDAVAHGAAADHRDLAPPRRR